MRAWTVKVTQVKGLNMTTHKVPVLAPTAEAAARAATAEADRLGLGRILSVHASDCLPDDVAGWL